MKKTCLLPVAFLASVAMQAQVNVQLHYDLGRRMNPDAESTRANLTSTVEMFRPDATGSTYFFIDFDYYSDGVGGAYWEVSREWTLGKSKSSNAFAAHVEYNGGLSINKYTEVGSRFQQCVLVGPAWNWHSMDFSRTFSTQLLYKQYFKQSRNDLKAFSSFQWTNVWGINFAQGWCTFSGYTDLWYGYIPRFDAEGQRRGWVFTTEPQFWVNLKHKSTGTGTFSVGTEWEISQNFIWANNSRTFFVNPTLAVKYTF
jgi:hypothetical protein